MEFELLYFLILKEPNFTIFYPFHNKTLLLERAVHLGLDLHRRIP
jgi:hypothetical protein